MARVAALIRNLWRNLVRRDRVERTLDTELRAYVELLTEENLRAGMTPQEARRVALLECRGVEQVKERVREAWVGGAFVTAVREVRHATRSLFRSPAYLLVSVGTLAIGLGGATAVFTVVAGSLLRPLPGTSQPDRLVSVERVQRGQLMADWSYADYRDLRDRSRTLDGLAAYNGTSMALDDASGSARAWVSYVSDNFFDVLGVRAASGRLFGVTGARAPVADGRVVVLSHDLWQRRYGGSTDVIGSVVDLRGHAFVVVGVAAPGFVGAMAPYPMEMWVPVAAEARLTPPLATNTNESYGINLTSRRSGWLRLVGRLAPGGTVDDAQTELVALADWLASAHATNRERSVRVFPGAGMTADERAELSRTPRLLAMAVGLLLLIACGNVAALALVRSATRRRELATRLALGAARGTLMRQVAIEGSVLAVLAGGVGVLLARALLSSATLVSTVVPIPDPDLTLDGRVLAVALAASAFTALGVSLIPAFQILGVPAGAVLREGGRAVGRTSAGARGQRLVVAVQVAASLVLLAAASMIYGSFQRVLAVHDDVDPRGLTYASFDVTSIPDPRERLAFYRAVLTATAAEPALAGATLASSIPPFDWAERVAVFRRGEEPPPSELAEPETELGTRASAVTVSEGFFDVMRIPLERGRAFTARDRAGTEPVVILGRRLADALWPGGNALGEYVAWPAVGGPDRPPLRVVGIAADTRPVIPGGEPPLFMYIPFAQRALADLTLVVRSRGDDAVNPETWRRIGSSAGRAVELEYTPKTLYERLAEDLQSERTASAWVGVFGVIALLLAALGVYGVLAQSVLQRTHELAVRSVLGATPTNLYAMVTADGARLAVAGGMLGALGAVIAFRVIQAMFSTISIPDIGAAAVAVALLALAMSIATWIPARRAARLDPAMLLRSD